MYHEDRLGGTKFSRVWLCGGGVGREAEQVRAEIQKRLGVPVEAGRHSGRGGPRRPHQRLDRRAGRAGGAGRRAAAGSEGGLMLKGNLSTRPFYNERVGQPDPGRRRPSPAWCWPRSTPPASSSTRAQRSERTAAQAAAETAAEDVRASAEREQQKVDRTVLARLGAETQEANDRIDERLFSWTVFFGLVEKTLPLDARLVAVAPSDENGELPH